MNSLEDKLGYLEDLNKTIVSVKSDILDILSQNRTLSNSKNDLEDHIEVLTQENQELTATKKALDHNLGKMEKELLGLKNELSNRLMLPVKKILLV